MNIIELQGRTTEGTLNRNILLMISRRPRLILRREPKDSLHPLQEIAHEYEGLGFFKEGGLLRRRGSQEQAIFTIETSLKGLKVLPPCFSEPDSDNYYYPFLGDSQPVNIFLSTHPEQGLRVTNDLITDLRYAHRNGVIYGDRWSPNILVSLASGLRHIDFDLEITGPCAQEFEVAQVLYYMLLAKPDLAPNLARQIDLQTWFNLPLMINFLENHSRHFQGTEYEVSEDKISLLVSLLTSQRVPGRLFPFLAPRISQAI